MNDFPTYSDFKKKYTVMPFLILPIKLFWFKKIWQGEKLEEYREIKPYYIKRLEKFADLSSFSVGLRAGYRADSPFLVCMCKLKKGEGFEKWGAETGKKYYVLEIQKLYKGF